VALVEHLQRAIEHRLFAIVRCRVAQDLDQRADHRVPAAAGVCEQLVTCADESSLIVSSQDFHIAGHS